MIHPCCFRCWPTEWTCPTDRWAAYCAAAPRRRCLPASWSVTQTCTRLPGSTCSTTPSITSSWLLLSWSVNYFIRAQERLLCLSKKKKKKKWKDGHPTVSVLQMPHEAASLNSAEVASTEQRAKNQAVATNGRWLFKLKKWIKKITFIVLFF